LWHEELTRLSCELNDLSAASLDAYARCHHINHLVKLITYLRPATLREIEMEYGPDLLLWTWINRPLAPFPNHYRTSFGAQDARPCCLPDAPFIREYL